ncbi:DUF5050 domain-containing protein [Cohnella caldifontis]|uniref:DUF5050 domain-containing protein n=1 Tax=Cohnella caldifontis TaxID=3027471 RepID=UPI0023EC617B|nr:DUF5050 domain-containing protein [Cohnella sp. YIM B05605]
MRKKWTGFAIVLSVCMSLLAPAGHSRAADTSVKVTLPKFAVSLNGHQVDNAYRQYPLLVYRGITYFPMTWNDSRLLGLETNESPESGLNVRQSPVASAYAPDKSKSRNTAAYTAKISTGSITVNGKAILSAKEPYPILSFRNVAYFPLTWRFAHDEFGWDYKWSADGGLRITSHNPQLQTAGLPAYAGKNDVALFKGYYYFVETKGAMNHVYRAPEKQPSAKKEIYSYAYDNLDWPQTQLSFQIRDNTLWLTYHVGGGVMGSDRFVKIGDDGKAELMHDGYLDFRETPYGTLIVRLAASAFEGGNLILSPSGKSGPNNPKVGDPGLMYAVRNDKTSWDLGPGIVPSYMAVIGEYAYVYASRSESDANHIYRINLKTNQTEKIVSSSVSWFRDIENKLYYIKDEDQALYSAALDGSGETKLSDHAVSWFDGIDGNVFYATKKSTSQFELYNADPDGDDPLVWSSPIVRAQVAGGRLVCELGGKDGVAILDSDGRLLAKVTDPISRVLPSDEEVLLLSARDSSIELIR